MTRAHLETVWAATLALAAPACAPVAPPPLTLVIGTSAPAVAPSSSAMPSSSPKVVAPIAWETSEPAARERARHAGLPLLVWVRAEWDAGSLEMERKTWADPRVIEAARPFVALRLDVTVTEGDAERYAERYDVTGVPMTILFDGSGHRVAAFLGSRDAPSLAAALHRAAGP